MDIWKHSFSEGKVMQWQRLPEEVGESPSLEEFRSCGDVALRAVVSVHGGGGLRLGLEIWEVFSNLSNCMILDSPDESISLITVAFSSMCSFFIFQLYDHSQILSNPLALTTNLGQAMSSVSIGICYEHRKKGMVLLQENSQRARKVELWVIVSKSSQTTAMPPTS